MTKIANKYEVIDNVEKLEKALKRLREAQVFMQPIHRSRLTKFSLRRQWRPIK